MHHGQRVIGWRDVPDRRLRRSGRSRATSHAGRCGSSSSAARARPDDVRAHALHDPQARRPRAPNSAATTSTSRRCSSRTVVYKGLMLAEQVGAFYPDLADARTRLAAWRWCTRASRPTRSRRGSARTVTASSRTTARSTRCAATALDARARGAAQERRLRRRHRGLQADHPAGRLRLGVARQRGRLPRRERALAAARDDDARARRRGPTTPTCPTRRRRFYEYHGCLVEPWDGPAALAFTDGDAHRRDARSQRPAPGEVRRHAATGWSCWRASSACSTSIRRASSRRGACSRARCSSSTPTQGASSPTTRSSSRSRRRSRTREWVDENKIDARRRSPTCRASTRSPHDELARAAAGVRLHRRGSARSSSAPMAAGGEEPVGSMGIDIPLAVLSRAAAAALPLLQAAVRAGHQPADRSDPRGARDVARELRRRRGQPARGDAAAVPHARAAAPVPHATTTSRSCARTSSPTSARPRCPMHFTRRGRSRAQPLRRRSTSSAARRAAPSTTARASSS